MEKVTGAFGQEQCAQNAQKRQPIDRPMDTANVTDTLSGVLIKGLFCLREQSNSPVYVLLRFVKDGKAKTE